MNLQALKEKLVSLNLNYEYDQEQKLHIWYDDKVHGTVFSYTAEIYLKEQAFDRIAEDFPDAVINIKKL